jgi:hypothetical protein
MGKHKLLKAEKEKQQPAAGKPFFGGAAPAAIQRAPDPQPKMQQSPHDKATVAAAKAKLKVLEPQLAQQEGAGFSVEAERLRVLADRKMLDDNAADPAMPFKRQAEETNWQSLNLAPVKMRVTDKEVIFDVKFHVRFEDASMNGKFGDLTKGVQAGIDLVWKQQLAGVFAGRNFTINPSFTLITNQTPRDKNAWLITVRTASTGIAVTYPGCKLEQPDPKVATSVTDPMCDGGVMSIPPSHISHAGVLGHELLHLFGLIDRYMMMTSTPPAVKGQPAPKPVVTLNPTRTLVGRKDPLGGEDGTILREDLGYIFNKMGVYDEETRRVTPNLGYLKREVMRLQEIVRLGYDPNSMIRDIIRQDFNDKMIKDAENL